MHDVSVVFVGGKMDTIIGDGDVVAIEVGFVVELDAGMGIDDLDGLGNFDVFWELEFWNFEALDDVDVFLCGCADSSESFVEFFCFLGSFEEDGGGLWGDFDVGDFWGA
jgi:hypothetical protein